jgi:alkylation response protein AidB-like acyl-CoA dehydrogenase
MCELGWPGVLVPEDLGGTGGSLVDAAILIEELTRALAPVPYAGNAVLAAAALRLFAAPRMARECLADLAAGSRFSIALDETLDWPPGPGRGIAWQWVPGSAALVGDGCGLQRIGPQQVAPSHSQDLLRGCGRVEIPEPRSADPASEPAQRFVAHAHVANAAALVGAMAGALDLTVAHASQREQFGRKIGAFQAVRHLCADMLTDLEASRSALYGAAWAVDHLEPRQAARSAAIAKAWCAESARRVCESAVQVHGGIGCTWEADVHLHLRAAHVEAACFGGRNAALDLVAQLALERGEGRPRESRG